MTEPDPRDHNRDQDAQDAAWRDIVAHYGERVELPPEEDRRDDPGPAEYVASLQPFQPDWSDPVEPDPEDHYNPPPAPPVPRPEGPRLAAWLGVFGAPVLLIVLILFGVAVTGWIGFALFAAFVAGFGYLVATMRKGDDDDPWDDGAVV